jgi:hypothetical protein
MKNSYEKKLNHKKSKINLNINLYQNIRNDIKPDPYSIIKNAYLNHNLSNKTIKNSKNNDSTLFTLYNTDNYYSLRNSKSFIKTSYIQNHINYLKLPQPKKIMKKYKIINKITCKVPEKLLIDSNIICDKYNNIYFPKETNFCNDRDFRNTDNNNYNSYNSNNNNNNNIYNTYMKNISHSQCENNKENKENNNNRFIINSNKCSNSSLNMIKDNLNKKRNIYNNNKNHQRIEAFIESSIRPKSFKELSITEKHKSKKSNNCSQTYSSNPSLSIYSHFTGFFNEYNKENNCSYCNLKNINQLNILMKEKTKKMYKINNYIQKENTENKSSSINKSTRINESQDNLINDIKISNSKIRSLTSDAKNHKYCTSKSTLNKRNILQQKSLKNNVIYRKASKTLECKNYIQKENMNIKYISNNNLKIISSSLYNHSNDYNNINKIDAKKEQKLVKKNLINIVLKNKNQTIQRIINY